MRFAFIVLSIGLFSACGGEHSISPELDARGRSAVVSAGSGRVEGELSGRSLEIAEAVFIEVASQDPDDASRQVTVRIVAMSDRPGLCADMQAGVWRRASATAFILLAPGPSDVVTPGTYSISTRVHHYPGATVSAGFLGDRCERFEPIAELHRGTVTVEYTHPSLIRGHFEGAFGMASAPLRGEFEATRCDVDLEAVGRARAVCLE